MIGQQGLLEKPNYLFRKPCVKCGEMFRPTGRATQVCDECKEKEKQRRKKK
jgi:hypothetical protein